jgi:hypothetical protein
MRSSSHGLEAVQPLLTGYKNPLQKVRHPAGSRLTKGVGHEACQNLAIAMKAVTVIMSRSADGLLRR